MNNWCRPTALSRALVTLVMLVIVIAATAKLIDLTDFRNSLRTWDGVPVALRTPLAVAVPLVELTIAGAWLVGLSRRRAPWAALALLLTVTAAYGLHWAFIKPPNCDCFGKIAQFKQDTAGATLVVLRNAVLMGLLGCGLWLAPRGGRSAHATACPSLAASPPEAPGPDSAQVDPASSRVPRGFTLIEVLLVMAIVGVLTALLAPSLARFRVQAQRTAGLTKISQHARAFVAYTADFREYWPAITSPTATWTVLRGGDQIYKAEYFDAVFAWPIPLADVLYGTTWRDKVFAWKGDSVSPFAGGFWYSAAFLASPDFWNASTRTGPSQWGPTRAADVLFPSSKALIVRVATTDAHEPDPDLVWFAMVDGSGTQLRQRETKATYPNGSGVWQGSSQMSMTFPGLGTIDGVRGRDK